MNASKTVENVDTRKFSLDSLTHQYSVEEDSCEAYDGFTKLIERSNWDTSRFPASPSRKTSKISNTSLAFIQEEEGPLERNYSTDFESYSGNSSL